MDKNAKHKYELLTQKVFVIFCNLADDVLSEVTRLPAAKNSMTVQSDDDDFEYDEVDNDYEYGED